MKKIYTILLILFPIFYGCGDILDVEQKSKITADQILSTPEGVEMYLANIYGRLPIEDFLYFPSGFFIGAAANGTNSNVNNGGITAADFCDESAHSSWGTGNREEFSYWEDAYVLIRDINILIQIAPTLNLDDAQIKELEGEGYFLRAFTYFALVKRYGGVSIIKEPQVYEGDPDALKVPRSTEKDTWDFILEDCNLAIEKLGDQNSPYKANKWVALALKSRAALFAGSIAKYSHEPYVSFSGPAVDQELVGIPQSEADYYFNQCIDASSQIMQSGKFDLYKGSPTNATEAAANYQALFEKPTSTLGSAQEPIFIKAYNINTSLLAHNYDIWFRPNQLANGWPHPGRMNPLLDLVDVYEDYTDDGNGKSASIQTRVDGNESNYSGFNNSVEYYTFPSNNPLEMFKAKDARLHATLILPGSTWKNTKIVIQGGLIQTDGKAIFRTEATAVGLNGKTYYTYGSDNNTQYSGFNPLGENYTRTGFLFKKFLQEQTEVIVQWGKGSVGWIEFRYAEILLNYAEAAAELSDGTVKAKGKEALNLIRKRAAHKDEIPLTIENVRKERRIELAFENKRSWDLIRWRIYHTEFNNRYKKALVPFLDLRHTDPKYIFVRMNMPGAQGDTFRYTWYYQSIPGIGSNGLVQNPI